MDTYYVYILFSESLQNYYAGQTKNIEERLQEHNRGKGKYTSKGIPWKIVMVFVCETRSEAVILENKIKKRGIKRYLEDQGYL